MGVSYRPDNPFAQHGRKYSPDNPFAPKTDTGDIDLRTNKDEEPMRLAPVVVTKPGKSRKQEKATVPVLPKEPGRIVADAGADYLQSELQRGGAALVQQAKDLREARLHGVGHAALSLGKSLAHGIVDPMVTFGQLLASPEDEMAGTPDAERKTGLQAYNRETERLAQLAAHNVRNNTPGPDQDIAAEEAANAVRARRKREAIIAPIATAANYAAPGVFKAVEKAALPAATRALGKFGGALASRLAGEGAAGAVVNAASDPAHPIASGVTGAAAGVVLGEAGHLAGHGAASATRVGAEGARRFGKLLEEAKTKPAEPAASESPVAVERRAEPRPQPSEMSPEQRAAYRQRLVSEQQRLTAYAGAEPNPDIASAYEARHARLGKEIEAIDAVSPPTHSTAEVNAPGQVNIRRMNVNEIVPDPERFQYKEGADADTGAGGELKGLSKYDEQLAGVISVWRDPKTGIVHPVNGHNRLALAKRTGHPSVNVQEITARTAQEARAQGALANIAEGRGTALDAATFFRETGLSEADLRDRVSFKGMIAKRGMAISHLAPDIFDKVATGKLPESHAAAIGEMLPGSPELQRTAVSALEKSRARLSEGEVRELARQISAAGTEHGTQETLFGAEGVEIPLYIEKAKLANAIQRKLAADRRMFGYVAKEGRAEGLARAGNVIDVSKSRSIAEESAKLEEIFSRLYTRAGPIADALHEGARRLANGEGKQADIIEQLYPAIEKAVQDALAGGTGPSGGTPGVGNQDRQSETGYDATGRQAAGVEEGQVRDSTDPSQGALLSPEHFNEGELREPWPVQSAYDQALTDLWREQGRNGRRELLERWSKLYPEQKWLSGWADLPVDDLPQHVREQIGMERVRQGVALNDLLNPKDDGDVRMSPEQQSRQRRSASEPERLEVFAVKAPDGSIIEGRSWRDALMRAVRAGIDVRQQREGFMTSHGRFVPAGREAMIIAYHADQLRRNTTLYKTLSQGAIPLEISQYSNEGQVRGVGGRKAALGPEPDPLIAARITGAGVERRPDTNPFHEVWKRKQDEEAGRPRDLNNPESGPQIESRAIKSGDGLSERVDEIGHFSEQGHYLTRDEAGVEHKIHAIEGYKLSDGSFITREEAKAMFPDADFGPQGRDASGPLFSPEKYSDDNPFVLRSEDEGGQQQSLFGEREGTAASRNLSAAERHAQSEATRIRQILGLETDPARRAKLARELAEHEKLLNRAKPISEEELRTRAIAAEEESKPGTPPPGPDQGVLLAPASQLSQAGVRIRKALGIKNSNLGEVVALRKISVNLANAIGVPLREGRGNLKRIGAMGAFWQKAEVIRVRRLKAIDTVAHEVGHYLSKKYDLKFNAKMLSAPDRMTVARELVKMGRDLYGNRKPSGGYGEEGIAQWVRFFVTEPQRMVADAPTFTAYMDKLFDREPALRDILLKARDDFALYEASPADAKIGSMVERSIPSRFAGMSAGKLIDHLFNDLQPIRRAVEKMGGASKMSENAANLAELTKGNAGRARDILDNGAIKFNSEGKRVTRGLTQILKEIGEANRDEFTNYLVSKQVLTKTMQGIDTGFDVPAAREIVERVERDHPEWAQRAEEIWDFRSALLQYEADAGLLTQHEVDAIREGNPTPTPFYRSFEGEEAGAGGGGRSVKLARNSSGVYRMKGSDRPVIDPLQSIVNDAYTMVDRAQKHYAASVLIKSALDLDGGGHIAQLLPEPPKELRRIDLNRVEEQLTDAGWTPPQGEDGFALKYLQAFYEKRVAGAREVREQVLPILIDGKRRWVQINDKSTWEALEGMSVPEIGILERMVASPTRWLRMGATAANPDFAIINPLRDAFPAAIYSAVPLKETHLPGYAVLHGAGHMLKEALHIGGKGDVLAERFAQEGAESAGMVGADIRTMTVAHQRTIHEMMRSQPRAILDHFLPQNWVKSIAEQFQIFENATRLGEFSIVRSDRMKRGMPEREASVEGAYAGRNATQDFQKQGRTIRYLNRYVPFLGAHMGDILKLSQEFNPMNLATPEGRARYATVGLRAMAYITVPSVALYLLQHDDPDYQEVPEYLKANAWVIIDKENGPIPFTLMNGKKVRVWLLPRPYMLGYIFGYAPEKILAKLKDDDPDAFADMAKYGASAFIPPWMPTIAAPFIENARNKTAYSGRPIVPEGKLGLEPSEQSAPHTGEVARLLGKGLNQSPAQIENVARGYGGGLGQTGLRFADVLVKKGEEAVGKTPLSPETKGTASDPFDYTPIAGRFISSQPGANAKSVSRIYDDYEAAERKRETWRSFIKAAKNDLAAKYLKANMAEIASVASEDDTGGEGGPLRQVHKALGDIAEARRQLMGSRLPADQLAAKLKELGLQERTIARNYYHKPNE